MIEGGFRGTIPLMYLVGFAFGQVIKAPEVTMPRIKGPIRIDGYLSVKFPKRIGDYHPWELVLTIIYLTIAGVPGVRCLRLCLKRLEKLERK